MGLLDKIAKIMKAGDTTSSQVTGTAAIDEASENTQVEENIVLAASFYMVEDEGCGEDDGSYFISFKVNDVFKETKCHAAEVEMLYTYAPEQEYGEEGKFPYLAILFDDKVYCAVEEFKEKGTFTDAIELTALSGKFYFKAKMEYFGYIMYFYGLDRCNGFWENNGLCMVYPKRYVGTENEKKLMWVLDETAESYREERKEK